MEQRELKEQVIQMNKMNKYREGENKAVKIMVLTALIFISNVFSVTNASANPHHIRQERIEKNGVYISRPSQEDVEISNILIKNDIKSPEEYAQWLKSNIQYKNDAQGQDNWIDPLELLNNKKGDCEDFTLLNIAVLRVMGYQARFVAFLNEETQGHAVCVFEYNGQHFYFDNMNLKKIEEKNVMEFVKNKIAKNAYTASEELDLSTRKWKMLYKIA